MRQREVGLASWEKKLHEKELRNDKRLYDLISRESIVAEREVATIEKERLQHKSASSHSKQTSEIVQEDDFLINLGKKTYGKPNLGAKSYKKPTCEDNE